MKIYLAGPLFTLAERKFNEVLTNALKIEYPGIRVILPQKKGRELAALKAKKLVSKKQFLRKMYKYSIFSIEKCDAVVAILDGADADSGTCIELGYAKAIGKRIIGVRTDFRGSEDRGLNLMISGICSRIIMRHSTVTSIKTLAKSIASALNHR